MPFDLIKEERSDPTSSARVWAGTVTLSSGTATIDYSADLPGVGGDDPACPGCGGQVSVTVAAALPRTGAVGAGEPR